MSTKSTIIGLKELRENTETYIKRVEKGESITIIRRSVPIFRLTPVDSEESNWEPIADFTLINKNGISAKDILSKLNKIDG